MLDLVLLNRDLINGVLCVVEVFLFATYFNIFCSEALKMEAVWQELFTPQMRRALLKMLE